MKKSLLAFSAVFLATQVHAADAPAILFPSAFSVEHQVVQTDPGGDTFRAQPVVDTYGGSTLVSVRPGGSRVIVDFARRTITEVSVEKSTYWTLSFSQMGDLSRRLARAEERPLAISARAPNAAVQQDIRVQEVSDGGRENALPDARASRSDARHFRAFVDNGPSADVWVDGTVRVSPAALEAFESFEREALGSTAVTAISPAQLVGAARRAADGAVPVRVRRPLSAGGGAVEDVVTALTPLPAFPQNLLVIGDGFHRVPSPLEGMVAFAEDEASRDSSRLVK